MEHQQSSGRDNNFLENVVMFMSFTELYTTGIVQLGQSRREMVIYRRKGHFTGPFAI